MKIIDSIFKNPLKQSGLGRPFENKLLQAGDDARFVIRHRRVADLQRAWESLFKETITVGEVGEKFKAYFDELGRYGVSVPTSFVIGEHRNKGVRRSEPELYILTERIQQVDVRHASPEEQEHHRQELRKLFESLLTYHEDKKKEGQIFLCDILDKSQYVYGMKEGEKNNRYHLVDTDPYLAHGKDMNDQIGGYFLLWVQSAARKYKAHFLDIENRFIRLQKQKVLEKT